MIVREISNHAHKRLQQRAVPPLVIGLLEQFGSFSRCCGADRITFDKAVIKRLKRRFSGERGLRLIEPWLDVFAVIREDGHIMTVAHQTRRMWRNRWVGTHSEIIPSGPALQ